MTDTDSTTATKRPRISPTVEVAFIFGLSGLLAACAWICAANIEALQGPAIIFALGPLLAFAIGLARWVESPKFPADIEQSRLVLAYAILAATWPVVLLATVFVWFFENHLIGGPLTTLLGSCGMLVGSSVGALLLTFALYLMTNTWDWRTFFSLVIAAVPAIILWFQLDSYFQNSKYGPGLDLGAVLAFSSTAYSAIFGVGLLRNQPTSTSNPPSPTHTL